MNFDDILKEGKGKVTDSSTKKKKWKKHINNIMEELHMLNNVYGSDTTHNLNVEPVVCKKCKVASYILAVRDLDNHQKVTRFHKNKWESLGKKAYYCNKCAKKK